MLETMTIGLKLYYESSNVREVTTLKHCLVIVNHLYTDCQLIDTILLIRGL